MYVCMCLCMCVCMYMCVCVCVSVCMYLCVYVSMYLCYVCMHVPGMYVCMYVCMYACMYVCMGGMTYFYVAFNKTLIPILIRIPQTVMAGIEKDHWLWNTRANDTGSDRSWNVTLGLFNLWLRGDLYGHQSDYSTYYRSCVYVLLRILDATAWLLVTVFPADQTVWARGSVIRRLTVGVPQGGVAYFLCCF
jgi:hypothetical protein